MVERKGEYYEMIGFNAAHNEGATSPDEIETKRKRKESEKSVKESGWFDH